MSYTLTGRESLGIEFGSTRIKAVLVDEECNPIASGGHTWENKYENGVWTYHNEDIWIGLQDAYAKLNTDCETKFGSAITDLSSIGFSGMMHGYLPFDKDGNQLAEFRTWRNTITADAASRLTSLFDFNIPQRWSIAHLYQAVLNNEDHIGGIAYLTTLAGYVHWQLSDSFVLGVGEASGVFPIDSDTIDYNKSMMSKFDSLPEIKNMPWKLGDILPKVLPAGDSSCRLTEKGARLLDPSARLNAGIIMCPPEGDAGTGMTATNSITVKTGNISAGTSIFSMIVLEKQLSQVYEAIDMVTTPDGMPVAMVHCNNCCTDLDYWVNIFAQLLDRAGADVSKPQLYDMLYDSALDAKPDCGGVINFNYFSGEPVSDTKDGRPMVIRTQGADFSLPNFMRSQIYSAMATLKIGMEILEKENVTIDCLMGHGGLFKTPVVGQRLMAGAMNSPVAVMETAGEGGAWGMAILASYAVNNDGQSLSDYLNNKVFSKCKSSVIYPDENDVKGFEDYMKLYKSALPVQRSAYENV